LEKIRETKTQAGLSARERARNLDQALRVAGKACRLPHQHIVLVDDVVTTGATVNACARAAARAGLEVLAVWALALTRNPRDASAD
jgi:predicted amidophosphoribosyltransferase